MALVKPKGLTYSPPDLVLASMHSSDKLVRVVRACRGSGKSTSMFFELFGMAVAMPPQADGVRRSEFLISRTTYRALQESTVKSYIERFAGVQGMRALSGFQPWQGGISLALPDGTQVESAWNFMAVGPDDLDKLGSYQCTAAWVNELADYPSGEIINAVLASTGRYPSKDGFAQELIAESDRTGVPIYRGQLIADTNGPWVSSWIRDREDNPPDGWEFFVQEPPLLGLKQPHAGAIEAHGQWWVPNPAATFVHVQAQGYAYWLNLLGGSEQHFLESKILGQYANTLAGKRVYPEFAEDDHVWKTGIEMEAFENDLLRIGIDTSGFSPAAVLGVYKDQTLWILDELVGEDISFEQWVDEELVPLLSSPAYANMDMLTLCDPSNPANAITRSTAMQVLMATGLECRLATNAIKIGERLSFVKKHMNRRNGFRMLPQCTNLLNGLRGAYRYEEVKGKAGLYRDTPTKGPSSHGQDALQYLASSLELDDNRQTEPVRARPSQRRAA